MSFMFQVLEDEWSELDTDKPVRHIKKIGSVIEVSVVTFPAYQQTFAEIETEAKRALDNARSSLEKDRQESVKSLDSDLELLKAKTKILMGVC